MKELQRLIDSACSFDIKINPHKITSESVDSYFNFICNNVFTFSIENDIGQDIYQTMNDKDSVIVLSLFVDAWHDIYHYDLEQAIEQANKIMSQRIE